MSENLLLTICKTLIANALRKKQFYRDAIELKQYHQVPNQIPTKTWFKWDPISSGKGDLLLEDMLKSFSASSKVSKTMKTIDFASVIDNMTSHGFQVKALISQTRAMLQPPDNGKISFSAVEIVFFLQVTIPVFLIVIVIPSLCMVMVLYIVPAVIRFYYFSL